MSGDGNDLVEAIKPVPVAATRQRAAETYKVSDAMRQAFEVEAPPTVGEVLPQQFVKPLPEKLTDNEFLDLVYYYNEDFGIVREDTHGDRVSKFRKWLMEEPI